MEVNADQIIFVHCKFYISFVLQDFPINCSKCLTLIFELRPFSHSRWCLQQEGSSPCAGLGWAAMDTHKLELPFPSTLKRFLSHFGIFSRCTLQIRYKRCNFEGSVGHFRPKNLIPPLLYKQQRAAAVKASAALTGKEGHSIQLLLI